MRWAENVPAVILSTNICIRQQTSLSVCRNSRANWSCMTTEGDNNNCQRLLSSSEGAAQVGTGLVRGLTCAFKARPISPAGQCFLKARGQHSVGNELSHDVHLSGFSQF